MKKLFAFILLGLLMIAFSPPGHTESFQQPQKENVITLPSCPAVEIQSDFSATDCNYVLYRYTEGPPLTLKHPFNVNFINYTYNSHNYNDTGNLPINDNKRARDGLSYSLKMA